MNKDCKTCGADKNSPSITREQWKSCCGSMSFVLQMKKPIKKTHIHFFTNGGFTAPQNFLDAGIFYVQRENMIATASFGATRVSIRCNGPKCGEHLDLLQSLLETAINS